MPDERTERDRLAVAINMAQGEFENIRWEDVLAAVAETNAELAKWTRKYVRYLRTDLERAAALLTEDCGYCDGTGRVGRHTPNPEPCPDCGGHGYFATPLALAGEPEATAALRHAKRELREVVARLDTVLQRGGLDRATEAARNTVASITGQLEVLADDIDAVLPVAPQDATGEEVGNG